MTTKIRPASLQDVVAIMEIENSTNQMPWTKNQFLSSMEVGHYSMVLQQYQKVIGFAIYAPIIPESHLLNICLLYTSPSPRDATLSRMPSSA